MQVTQDVILDLLPLYIADEVSPDTRALVVEFLARHPELAEHVRQQTLAQTLAQGVSRDAALPATLEVRALRRLRRMLALREWTLGLAWFFTALSLGLEVSARPGGGREFHLMLMRYPVAFVPLLLAAIGFWIGHIMLRTRASAKPHGH
jgi:anti-sigma factor RsiW